MNEQKPVNENDRADAQSSLNVELGLLPRIDAHIRQLSPHMMQRDGVVLLMEARDELKTWHDFGRAMADAGLNDLTIPLVPN